jgi:hypothetical protein
MAELPPADVIAQAVARVAGGSYQRWAAQVHAAGCCVRPVRLKGSVTAVNAATGETARTYTTSGEPDRVLYKAFETRRATRCPACAAVYQGDARALIIAGLAGGKGTPDSVAGHPTVFATLTAPSFGAVHSAAVPASRAHCHPGPPGMCGHGRPTSCEHAHNSGDEKVGTALCADCYDYHGAVIFNAVAAKLWDRTMTATRRTLAARLGVGVRQLRDIVTVSFVKVVEYQRRGVVHRHTVIRLDRHTDDVAVDANTLSVVVRIAASRAQAPNPLRPAQPVTWGRQFEVTEVTHADRRAVANYIAKYATKSTDDNGILDHQLHHPDTEQLPVPDHLRRMVQAAWQLGERPELQTLNLHRWAHALGYRGHWLTKSRTWSTTFTNLRDARHTWQLPQTRTKHPLDPWGRAYEDDNNKNFTLEDWDYTGIGYRTAGDAWLAKSAATNRRINRRIAWEERS